jgi:hypothetical protein
MYWSRTNYIAVFVLQNMLFSYYIWEYYKKKIVKIYALEIVKNHRALYFWTEE